MSQTLLTDNQRRWLYVAVEAHEYAEDAPMGVYVNTDDTLEQLAEQLREIIQYDEPLPVAKWMLDADQRLRDATEATAAAKQRGVERERARYSALMDTCARLMAALEDSIAGAEVKTRDVGALGVEVVTQWALVADAIDAESTTHDALSVQP